MKTKGTILSFSLVILFISIFLYFIYQLNLNLTSQNIATGFGFLEYEAGFEISESLINYDSFDNYGKALLVGLLNTMKMAVVGCFFAFLLACPVFLKLSTGSSRRPLLTWRFLRYDLSEYKIVKITGILNV